MANMQQITHVLSQTLNCVAAIIKTRINFNFNLYIDIMFQLIITVSLFILFQVIQERKKLYAQRQNEGKTSSSIEDVTLG
jgi:hypothetical protein